MSEAVRSFYDDLADGYHLIYESWESAIQRQSAALDELIQHESSADTSRLLDCSCGIGTQAIGLAQRGYEVFASDLSPKAIARARSEAATRGLEIPFAQADVRTLEHTFSQTFDTVISCDNSLPHLLTEEDLTLALRSIRRRLTADGLFVASIRDYDKLLADRPSTSGPPRLHSPSREVITFQLWDWAQGSDVYSVRLFLMRQTPGGWQVREHRTRYRALRRQELALALEATGFRGVSWHSPETSGYFQPVVTAHA